VAAEASIAAGRSKKARSSSDQERAQLTIQRCGNCGRTRHNTRTTYIGSLFDSDEIEEL
jgi:hypothetical protein